MNIKGENTKLKQFLLGSLSDKETDEIGLQIISDESFEEKMNFAEEDLIEEFLEDSLTIEEKQLFYTNFINCPARIKLLEDTALIKKYAQNSLQINPSEQKKTVGFFESLTNLLMANLRPIAAGLLILVLAGVAWRVFLYDANGDLSQTEKEYAALNAKDLNNSPDIANYSNKSLIAGTLRDTNSASKLLTSNLTDNILFRLALPTEIQKETVYKLELSRDGQTVFRQNSLRIYQNNSGQELKVILPKSIMSKGKYQIKLINIVNPNSALNYGFEVE